MSFSSDWTKLRKHSVKLKAGHWIYPKIKKKIMQNHNRASGSCGTTVGTIYVPLGTRRRNRAE